MENPVIIFGANYLGRAAREIFERNGNVVYCFLDDNKGLTFFSDQLQIPVIISASQHCHIIDLR